VNKERFKALLAEYGRIAIGTYFGLFFLVLAGFSLLFSLGLEKALGFEGPNALTGVGVLGAAYAATKVAQPLRIFATLALTPVVARLLKRFGLVRT